MKRMVIVFVAIAAQLSATAQEDLQVDKLSRKKFTWLTQKKLDSLAEVLDERLMYVHSNGWTQTKKEIIDDLKSGKLNYVSIDVKSNRVRVYHSTAIVNGAGRFCEIKNGWRHQHTRGQAQADFSDHQRGPGGIARCQRTANAIVEIDTAIENRWRISEGNAWYATEVAYTLFAILLPA